MKKVRKDVQNKLISLLKNKVTEAVKNGASIPRIASYETKWAKHNLYVDHDGIHHFSTVGYDGTLYMCEM